MGYPHCSRVTRRNLPTCGGWATVPAAHRYRGKHCETDTMMSATLLQERLRDALDNLAGLGSVLDGGWRVTWT
jgi:hypothetical protein